MSLAFFLNDATCKKMLQRRWLVTNFKLLYSLDHALNLNYAAVVNRFWRYPLVVAAIPFLLD